VEPVLAMKAVFQDPRYRAAPDEVKAFYWGAISLLWEEAEHAATGPRLKRRLLPGAAALIDWGLAREEAGVVEVDWLSKAWDRAVALHEQHRSAGKAGGLAKRRSSVASGAQATLERRYDSPVNSRPDHVCAVGTQPALKTLKIGIPEKKELILELQETHSREEGERGGNPKRRKYPYPPGFERFWKLYPVHREKPHALKFWTELHCEAITDLIVAKVELLKREDARWLRGFVKDPHRWLRSQGWEDEPVAPTKPQPRYQTAAERQMAVIRRTDEMFARLMRGECDGPGGSEEAGEQPGRSLPPHLVGRASDSVGH